MLNENWWTYDEERAWQAAVAKRNFTGLDKEMLLANALYNCEDVPKSRRLAVAIATMDEFIDQGVSHY